MQIETKLLSGALGAEIKGIDLTDISDENFKRINDLLLEHKVIFFRDQPLTAEQHIALAEKFASHFMAILSPSEAEPGRSITEHF